MQDEQSTSESTDSGTLSTGSSQSSGSLLSSLSLGFGQLLKGVLGLASSAGGLYLLVSIARAPAQVSDIRIGLQLIAGCVCLYGVKTTTEAVAKVVKAKMGKE